MGKSFVHLHCHTHYSLLDGANRIPELVQQTKSLGMNAVAITDHGNLYGAIEFYQECKSCGIKPILGYEAYVAPGSRHDKKATKQGDAYSHLTLLAKNLTGFRNLIKMASIAYLEGFYYYPRIDRELLEAHSEGLICLSGCLAGEFNDYLLKGEFKQATQLAEWYAKVFKENFYIEIQNNGLDLQDQCTPEAARIANKLGIPLVATADAHYLCQQDAEAHDVLFCINTGKKRDPNRKSYPEGRIKSPYYVRSPEDMYQLFPEYQDAVARSQEIADKIDIDLDFKKRHFPVFQPPDGLTPEEFLRKIGEEGLIKRYGENPPAKVRERFEHELNIICRMGFAGYFLIVWDFVRFARENGIPCSARGSGCGAVMGYVLFLSHVDPLEYDLLFERFLDPNRSEAPDIDIDFCQERRELVIDYVKRKYGESSVAQIATFGTLAAKAALKDVGRVLDIPLDRVNYMTKWVSPKPGTTIDDTLESSPEFRKEYESDPVTREWVDIARKLEGTNRNVGTHAAGVVIANGPITDYVPVQVVKRKDENGNVTEALTTQWVMGDLEKVGMLKMDFLGLRTLTLVDHAVKLIKKTRNIDIDIYKIPLDDVETYKMLQRGDAKGVFQFESEGIRELLKRMKPDNIRDIIASTALYRPGPLEGGMVDDYI
ncbi:MAG: DNA polymerase III subunit alpha, partial [Gemmataceae bacterium]|nr:DNA polymerase III subunit alpha [Gemmataceae bacterium]